MRGVFVSNILGNGPFVSALFTLRPNRTGITLPRSGPKPFRNGIACGRRGHTDRGLNSHERGILQSDGARSQGSADKGQNEVKLYFGM